MAEALVCSQCGYSNEPERVYCHGCGAKLDRSLLPKAAQEKDEESPEKARKRIQKMTNPKGVSILRGIKTFFVVILWSAVVAAILVCIQPPEDAPPVKNEVSQRLLQSDLMDLVESPRAATMSVAESEINQAWKNSLKGKDAAPAGFDFVRAYVNLHPGVAHIGLEQALFGFSIFTGIDYRPSLEGGTLKPVVVGGNIGRMPVHPAAMVQCGFLFEKLWVVLKRDIEHLRKMQQITIGEKQATLVSKGAGVR